MMAGGFTGSGAGGSRMAQGISTGVAARRGSDIRWARGNRAVKATTVTSTTLGVSSGMCVLGGATISGFFAPCHPRQKPASEERLKKESIP